MTAGSFSFDATAMPALPFSNSIGFVPWYTDMTRWPDASARHQGRTRCCFSTWRRSSPLPVQRCDVRTCEGFFEQQFLLLQALDELGPAVGDRVVGAGRNGGKHEVLQDRHDYLLVEGDRNIFIYEKLVRRPSNARSPRTV